MEIGWEMALAVLLAAVLLILPRGRVRSGSGAEVFILLRFSGEAAALEETVRGLTALRDAGRLEGRLILVDDGAEPSARRRAALLARDTGGLLAAPDSLKELLWTKTRTP